MKRWLSISVVLFGFTTISGCGGGGDPGVRFPPPAPLVIMSAAPPTGTTGAAYAGASGFALVASGGIAPYSWTWSAGANSSLPPGLDLTNNLITGTPTTAGSFSVTVSVKDSESPPSTKSATYVVSIDMPLEITSGIPPGGTAGTGYGPLGTGYFACVWSPVLGWHWACTPCDPSVRGSCPANPCKGISFKPCLQTQQIPVGFTFTASGGTSPYRWTASGIPAGLELDAKTGNLGGTPNAPGTYDVTVTVSDSESPTVQATASYSIDVSN